MMTQVNKCGEYLAISVLFVFIFKKIYFACGKIKGFSLRPPTTTFGASQEKGWRKNNEMRLKMNFGIFEREKKI